MMPRRANLLTRTGVRGGGQQQQEGGRRECGVADSVHAATMRDEALRVGSLRYELPNSERRSDSNDG